MTTLKVRDLLGKLPADKGERIQTPLEQVTVSDDGARITVTEDHFLEEQEPKEHVSQLDEIAERSLCKFLDVPFKYIETLDGELKAQNLNYWLAKKADAFGVFHFKDALLEDVYAPERMLIPGRQVANIITQNFDPNDDIAGFHRDDKILQIDVTTDRYKVDVDGNGVLDRPAKGTEADITHGGVRFYLPADLKGARKPTVSTFFNRLICSNGMTIRRTEDEVTLKGKTMDEILDEMEHIAAELLVNMDSALEGYKQTAEMNIPGNHIAFIRQIGREQGIGSKLIDKALDYAAGQGDRQWTLYDVINLYTSLAKSAQFASANKLQNLGGLMVTHAEHMIDRCGSCEQLLPTSHYAAV